MKIDENVYLIWKNLGETPLEALSRLRKEECIDDDIKMTYAGRLDPMAEGYIHILCGEKVHEKGKYTNMHKTYEVEFLVGFKTDTLDLLGLIIESSKVEIDQDIFLNETNRFISNNLGTIRQDYPAYSSKTVEGKPLFQWSREGKIDQIKLPSHEVLIKHVELNKTPVVIKGSDLIKNIESKIGLILGDFRQEEIIEKWRKSIDFDNDFFMYKIIIEAGSGFYVRKYIEDLSKYLRIPLVVYSIKRIRIF